MVCQQCNQCNLESGRWEMCSPPPPPPSPPTPVHSVTFADGHPPLLPLACFLKLAESGRACAPDRCTGGEGASTFSRHCTQEEARVGGWGQTAASCWLIYCPPSFHFSSSSPLPLSLNTFPPLPLFLYAFPTTSPFSSLALKKKMPALVAVEKCMRWQGVTQAAPHTVSTLCVSPTLAGEQRPAVSDGGDLPLGVSCQSRDAGQTECVWLKGQKSGIGEYAVPCARLCVCRVFPYLKKKKKKPGVFSCAEGYRLGSVQKPVLQLCSRFKCWQPSARLLTLQRLNMKSCEKSAAGSYVAHINLSVSAVYRAVCIVAGRELCRVPVIMHFIWPQTKTFASAFKVKAEQLSLGIWATHPFLWQPSWGKDALMERECPALLFKHFSTGSLRLCSVGVFIMLINRCINHNSALLITLREVKMLRLNSSGISDGWCVMMWWQFCALTLANPWSVL